MRGLGLSLVRRILEAVKDRHKAVPYLDTMTPNRFENDYLGTSPALVRRSNQSSVSSWPGFGRWTRKGLVHRYGGLKVSVGEVPYGSQYGRETWGVNISQVVHNMVQVNQRRATTTRQCRANDASCGKEASPLYVFDARVIPMHLNRDVPTTGLRDWFDTETRILLSQFALGSALLA